MHFVPLSPFNSKATLKLGQKGHQVFILWHLKPSFLHFWKGPLVQVVDNTYKSPWETPSIWLLSRPLLDKPVQIGQCMYMDGLTPFKTIVHSTKIGFFQDYLRQLDHLHWNGLLSRPSGHTVKSPWGFTPKFSSFKTIINCNILTPFKTIQT